MQVEHGYVAGSDALMSLKDLACRCIVSHSLFRQVLASQRDLIPDEVMTLLRRWAETVLVLSTEAHQDRELLYGWIGFHLLALRLVDQRVVARYSSNANKLAMEASCCATMRVFPAESKFVVYPVRVASRSEAVRARGQFFLAVFTYTVSGGIQFLRRWPLPADLHLGMCVSSTFPIRPVSVRPRDPRSKPRLCLWSRRARHAHLVCINAMTGALRRGTPDFPVAPLPSSAHALRLVALHVREEHGDMLVGQQLPGRTQLWYVTSMPQRAECIHDTSRASEEDPVVSPDGQRVGFWRAACHGSMPSYVDVFHVTWPGPGSTASMTLSQVGMLQMKREDRIIQVHLSPCGIAIILFASRFSRVVSLQWHADSGTVMERFTLPSVRHPFILLQLDQHRVLHLSGAKGRYTVRNVLHGRDEGDPIDLNALLATPDSPFSKALVVALM